MYAKSIPGMLPKSLNILKSESDGIKFASNNSSPITDANGWGAFS